MNLKFKDFSFLLIGTLALVAGSVFNNSIVALLITLGFGIYTVINHKNALIFLFVYVPIRPLLLEFNPALKAVGDMIIIISLLKVIYMYRNNWKSLLKFDWFEIAYISFCIIGAVSAFLTGVSIVAIISQIRAFILFYLLFYVVKRLDISKQDILKLAWTIFYLTIIICIHGIIEKLSLRGMLLPYAWESMPLSATNRIRIYGLVGNPNALGLFLSFSFIILMYLKSTIQSKGVWIINICIVLSMGVWVLTYSRGTWIAFVVTLISYALLTKNWRVIKTSLIAVIAGIILVALPVSGITNLMENTDFGTKQRDAQKEYDNSEGSFAGRMSETFDQDSIEGSMSSGRLYIVSKGFTIFKDQPLIGTGFGTFGDSATLAYGSPIYEKYNIGLEFFSDNQYIQVIVQTGIVGVILFAIFLLNMLYIIWKRGRESDYAKLLVSVLLGTFVIGIVYNAWESDTFTLFYFSMFGWLLSRDRKTRETT